MLIDRGGNPTRAFRLPATGVMDATHPAIVITYQPLKHQDGASLTTSGTHVRRFSSDLPIIPGSSLLSWLRVMSLVFEGDFPIIYNKMQQVTQVLECH